MFVALVGNLTLGNESTKHAGAYYGVDRAKVIDSALKLQAEWQKTGKAYQVFVGELTCSIEPVPTQYREVPISLSAC